MKMVLFQTSSTQRVTATQNEDGSWLLSKEWRHNTNESWIQGKGITLPKQHVRAIGLLLESDGVENDGFEFINDSEGVEESDFNKSTHKENTNNWHQTYAHYRQQNPVGRVLQ